jgi:hypothetical protein
MVVWTPLLQAQKVFIPRASGRGVLTPLFIDLFLGSAALHGKGRESSFSCQDQKD